MVIPTKALKIEGTPQVFQDENSESGHGVQRHFRGECGTYSFFFPFLRQFLVLIFKGGHERGLILKQRDKVSLPRSPRNRVSQRQGVHENGRTAAAGYSACSLEEKGEVGG